MKNIVLARIDDRLIHGQVMAKWLKKLAFNTIYVVDNGVAKDVFLCQMMRSIAPKDVKVVIQGEADAIAALSGEADAAEKICVITKTPEVFERLIQGGVSIQEIMLGGMGSRAGRKPLIRNAAASEEERATFKRLIASGIRVYYQDIPETKPTDLDKKL